MLHNSLLMDLAFFNSVYDRQGEQLVFCGIPTINRSDEYAANISLCALGAATTEYPQAVYELARYLMDYTYAPGYGFSVNREITDAQLENMQTTTTHVFPNHVWSQVTGNFRSYEEVEQESFEVQPLDQEWVEKIRFMLDHMAGAACRAACWSIICFRTHKQRWAAVSSRAQKARSGFFRSGNSISRCGRS